MAYQKLDNTILDSNIFTKLCRTADGFRGMTDAELRIEQAKFCDKVNALKVRKPWIDTALLALLVVNFVLNVFILFH